MTVPDEGLMLLGLLLVIFGGVVYAWVSYKEQRLIAQMQGFPEFEVEVLRAHLLHRRTVEEIAEELELPAPYIQRRLDQGMSKLVEIREKELEDDG